MKIHKKQITSSMKILRLTVARCLSLICLVLLPLTNVVHAQVPDLTNGEAPLDDQFWNLGPTGMRGWMYHVRQDSSLSRQIEVNIVDAGSPADGILAVGDVILGADGTGANPVNFTSDARIAFAHAIADAEANNPAILRILRWRAGATDTVSITLEHLGAYSATAPYNCPKSAAILEKGLAAIMAGGESDGNNFSLITLLAGNDPSNPDNAARMARAQQEAHELILTPEEIAEYTSGISLPGPKIAWEVGMKMMAIAEYYLLTGDAAVYESLRAYAIAYANGQSMFGTSGHRFAKMGPNGEINGPYDLGYGVVNSANMQCYYGVLLAREAGVTDQVVLDAIERATSYYGSYAHRGGIPYGEGGPTAGYESNGKSSAAAACLALEGTRNSEAVYFAKIAGTSAVTRDSGHSGPWFNYLWCPIGANVGGEASMAAYFAETSWLYDLARNWDGSFTYDTFTPWSSPNVVSYYSNIRLQQSMANLITYAMPLKQTYVTGKNLNPQLTLTAEELSEVQQAMHYDATTRTTNELIQDIQTWSGPQRGAALNELGLRRTEHAAILPVFENMAADTNASIYSRMGACFALGKIRDDSSVPLLAGLLTDPSTHVRWAAASSFVVFSAGARLAVVDTVLSACITTARPVLPLDLEDPIHHTHGAVAGAAMHTLAVNDLSGVDKELLYGAIRATANHPLSVRRISLGPVYNKLTRDDVEALADMVLISVLEKSPAGNDDTPAIRIAGLDLLQDHHFGEGVKLSMLLTEELIGDGMRGDGSFPDAVEDVLDVLIAYAGDSSLVEPDHEVLEWLNVLEATGSAQGYTGFVRDAITGDPGPYEAPESLKRINLVYADNATLTLPDYWTGLHVDGYDFAKGDTVYTWRKVHGAGEVSFHPNGTGAAKDTTVVFDGTPGEYLFEVKLSDSLGLTEVRQTVAVTLENVGGGLDPNSAPTAGAQSLTVQQGTPAQIVLGGTDPEGNPLVYTVTSGPSNGTLSGTAPYLVYTASAGYTGSDSIDFEVMDSEGQMASGTVSITVNAAAPVALAIYEPFEGYALGTSVNGLSGTGEIGLDGTWTAGGEIYTEDPGYTYGPLPTTGARLWHRSYNNPGMSRSIHPDALTNSGLLADGATLWFSMLIGADDSYRRDVQIALANSSFGSNKNYIQDDGADPGTGLGFELKSDSQFYAVQFFDGTQGTDAAAPLRGDFNVNAAGRFVRFGDLRLIVAKITWGAASDTVEMYLPYLPDAGDSIVLPDEPSSTLVANVDQSKFDVLTLSRGSDVWVDEIRFGATLQSVLMGTVDAGGTADDGVAPTPNPMAFALAPQVSSESSITMTASTAYDPLDVEYYFTCTAGGGNDSGWQDSNVYTDSGLTPGIAYSYTVKARDKAPGLNETAASASASATIPASGTVPDVVGLEQSIAESQLANAGMTVGTVTAATAYSLTTPAGDVMSQSPVGISSAAYGTPVDLEISIGQDPALPTLAPVDIVDNQGGLPVTMPATITYTLTFSQDLDASTIDAADFINLMGMPITIGSILEIAPGVVTVEVTLDTIDSGFLLFAIAQGAVIEDALGNALNTSSPIADEQVIQASAAPTFTMHIGTGGSWNKDTWNKSDNWDYAIPAGDIDVVIGAGNYASVAFPISGVVTPVYTGDLTLEAGSTLEIGQSTTADDLNALGTGTWILNSGTEIRMRYQGNSTHTNDMVLAGDALISVGRGNSAHHKERTFTGAISGTGLLTFFTTNGNDVYLQGNSTWSGGLLTGGVNSDTKESIWAQAAGSLGTGDVTIEDGVTLVIDAADAMGDSATLSLSGAAATDRASKLIMNQNDTIGALYLDGVLQPEGVYDSKQAWITGSGLLTVASDPIMPSNAIVLVNSASKVVASKLHNSSTSFAFDANADMIIVAVSTERSGGDVAVRYDGHTLSNAVNTTQAGIWYLDLTATDYAGGSADLVIDFTDVDTVNGVGVGVVSVSASGAGIDLHATETAASNLVLSTSRNGTFNIVSFNANNSGSPSVDAPLTEIYASGSIGSAQGAAGYQANVPAGEHSYSWTTTDKRKVVAAAFALEGYGLWALSFDLADGATGNDDGDALDNLSEYALGGNPTNAADLGYPIHFTIDSTNATYVHPQLSDPDSGIRYVVETTDNLVSNVWEPVGLMETNANGYAAGFDLVTNQIPTLGKKQGFIRLKIETE